MFGFRPYNYDRFTKEMLLNDVAKAKFGAGPDPGDRAPNFTAGTLDDGEVELSDFRGKKNVLLVFGSATCPFTASSIEGLNELYDDYKDQDVAFFFVYVREAHPGDRLPSHEDIHDKMRAAEFFRDEEEVEMPILVDDLKGSIHRKYGSLPNPAFLVDKSGHIAFRCLWAQAGVLAEALAELLEVQERRDTGRAVVLGGEDLSVPMRRALLHTHRALQRGGRRAIRDFQREMGPAGRAAELGSRIVAPVALNPGRAALGALLAGGVLTGAIFAGRALRNKRLAKSLEPYRYAPRARKKENEGDYAVGI